MAQEEDVARLELNVVILEDHVLSCLFPAENVRLQSLDRARRIGSRNRLIFLGQHLKDLSLLGRDLIRRKRLGMDNSKKAEEEYRYES